MYKRTHWIFSLILFWSFILAASNLIENSIHMTNACYGVYNNVLKLHCTYPKVINNVTRMLYAAKANKFNCSLITNEANYKKGCCTLNLEDCLIPKMNGNLFVRCIGQQECKLLSTWMPVRDKCEPDLFPSFTNFMAVEYQCGMITHKESTTIKTTSKLPPLISTRNKSTSFIHLVTTTANSHTKQTATNNRKLGVKTTEKISNYSVTTPRSTSIKPWREGNGQPALMLGTIIAITCGVVGMLLSVLCLWIYCRSKNQSSPDPDAHKIPSTNFWNNILPQSFTPKSFSKGYNNFTSFMPTRYPVLSYKDGQHAQILRSSSDASQSDQSVSSTSNQVNEQSPPNTPTTSHTQRDGAPFAFTIVNNLTT